LASGEFDRDQFKRELSLLALRVPLCKIGMVRSTLEKQKLLLNMPRVKTIVSDPGGSTGEKLVLLAEGCGYGGGAEDTPEALREIISKHGLPEPVPYTHVLGYEYLTADQVLASLLPRDVVCDIPSSFETVGHIAHLNLRDEQLPYKRLIGRVIMDKNDRIRTVVNKTAKIENEFRVLPMEVIAGSSEMETVVVQHGVRFKLNFAEVYWNSRLENEHNRLIKEKFCKGEVVLDMTCGVGPFTIPAAKKGCRVVANDLNPKCAEYTRVNCRLNKLDGGNMPVVHCMDARAFVRHVVWGDGVSGKRKQGEESPTPHAEHSRFDHAVINLPATGLDFVDVFRGLFDRDRWGDRALPQVHCYTFVGKQLDQSEAETAEGVEVAEAEVRARLFRGVVRRVEELLQCEFPEKEQPEIREVRDVAPNKRMVLVSFRVPEAAAFATASS